MQPVDGTALATEPFVNAKQSAVDTLFGSAVSWRKLIDTSAERDVVHETFVIEYVDSLSAEEALSNLRSHSDVNFAEFSVPYSVDDVLLSDEPLADSTFHLDLVNATRAWNVTQGNRSVRLAFVDTGIYFDHPDFEGQMWINPGEDLNGNGILDATDLDGVDNDGNGFIDDLRGYDFVDRIEVLEPGDFRARDWDATDDGSGHGTFVAGIAAAAQGNGAGISGVAPGVSIVPLRAFSRDGIGADIDIAAAIIYAADQGFEVINLSFGDVYQSSIMRSAIEYANYKGSVVVASGGNNGGDGPHYPSDYTDVISVVWLNGQGTGAESRATHGVGIDIGAPGSGIFTTLHPFDVDEPGEEDLYGRVSGSSMAAPMVSAAAALVLSLNSSLSPTAVRDILTSTATDLNASGWDHETASGRLNVERALLNTLPSRVEITSPTNNQGFAEGQVQVVGSVIHPDLQNWTLEIADGDSSIAAAAWSSFGASASQVYNGVLGTLDVAEQTEGVKTLRLTVSLKDGRDIEDRRRIYVDRTEPEMLLRYIGVAATDGKLGVAVDVQTDDLTDVVLRVAGMAADESVRSDRLSTRHGLHWVDASLAGGVTSVSVIATNVAGGVSQIDTTLNVPAARLNSDLFEVRDLSIPHGFLLDSATDFDQDGLMEIIYNRYQDGWIGDTLVVAEFDGTDFRRSFSIVANVFPRDVGDSNGNGLVEVLGQVGPASLVLEQAGEGGYPSNAILVDTSGISNPSGQSAVWSAGFHDVNDDGRDELISHNTSTVRILSIQNNSLSLFQEILNPTGVENSELASNTFEQPEILEGDFDGDGLSNILLGDGDGDWIMLEQDGAGLMQVTWTFETDRYSGSTRFGKGDYDGDGVVDFVTYTRNWLPSTSLADREPDLGIYYFWKSIGDDEYVLESTIAVPGLIDRHGSMASIDVDADGSDELVLLDSPDLYLMDRLPGGQRTLAYHLSASSGESPDGPMSARMVSGSFDGSANQFIVFANANGQMSSLQPTGNSAIAPPQWITAKPDGSDSVSLTWFAPAADSVTVFRSEDGAPFQPIATTTDQFLTDSTTVESEYRLQAWYNDVPSALGASRFILPHDPAIITEVTYPKTNRIRLAFSRTMQSSTTPDQFVLSTGVIASEVLNVEGGRAFVATFPSGDVALADSLYLVNVIDSDGLVLPVDRLAVNFPESDGAFLLATTWNVELPNSIEIVFNRDLDPTTVVPGNFSLSPAGSIEAVATSVETPGRVLVDIGGLNLVATGINPTLTLSGLRSSDNLPLAPEGNVLRLFAEPVDLENVLVYPNPVDTRIHASESRISGLPAGTRVTILTADGSVIARLPTTENAGEVIWDLRDSSGALVASGVYLLRIEQETGSNTFKKVVVVR